MPYTLTMNPLQNLPKNFFDTLLTLGIRLPVFIFSDTTTYLSVKQSLEISLSAFNQSCTFVDATDVKMSDKMTKALGSEAGHIILDATKGFDLKAFLSLSGKMRAGSILFCLLPRLNGFLNSTDATSLKWMNHTYGSPNQPITTPLFNQHFLHVIQNQNNIIIRLNPAISDWYDLFNGKLPLPLNQGLSESWQPPSTLTLEQREVFDTLVNQKDKLYLISAKRGRGKSFTIARFLEYLIKQAISVKYTAPRKSLVQTTIDISDYFIAPDALNNLCALKPDSKLAKWLIIDEAAMLPIVDLEKWILYFDHVVLTTTLEGYEGTGHGLRIKLLTKHKHICHLHLVAPIRFNQNDPLEQLTESLYLTNQTPPINTQIEINNGQNAFVVFHSSGFSDNDLGLAKSLYRFFAQIHYQTSPNDLRRLFDGNHQHFFHITNALTRPVPFSSPLIAAAWLIEEGGAEKELAKAIWQGKRRPKGNLVAQSLAIHANSQLMPIMKGLRVSRIGVISQLRRKKIASRLMDEICQFSVKLEFDYLSVSFGYEPHLVKFWHQHSFKLVHISHRADASSGQLSCMMIHALTPIAHNEVIRLTKELTFLYYSLYNLPSDELTHLSKRVALVKQLAEENYIDVMPPQENTANKSLSMSCSDLPECTMIDLLIGFSVYERSFEATRIALSHLIKSFDEPEFKPLQFALEIALSQSVTLTHDQIMELKMGVRDWLVKKNLLNLE